MRFSFLLGVAVSLSAGSQLFAVGATTPFTVVEAESGALGGGAKVHAFEIGSPVPEASTPELEASGGAYVELARTGQSISWKNPVNGANAINIRSSIPDAPEGGGVTAPLNLYVNGQLRQAITLSSKQSWVYRGAKPNPDNPQGGGMPFKFYNEDRAFIAGPPIPAGAVISLRRDADNTAEFYRIDSIDLEAVAPPLSQPMNSLSVVDFGADPTFTKDSTAAIRKCIEAARGQKKTVWLPPGKFMVNNTEKGALDLAGVTVSGAGMWHTMIYRQIPLPPPELPWRSNIRLSTNSVLKDLSINSNAIYKAIGGASGDDYGITAGGSNWLVDRVWVQHCDAQWMSGSDGIIQNSRVADSWADGINLNNGNRPNPDGRGLRLTARNNFVRGAGDDSIACFSDGGEKGDNPQMEDAQILNNTTVAPYWANGLRVAGGIRVVVKDNLVMDAAANNGMEISVFGKTSNPLESALITGNVILRGGGWNQKYRHGVAIASADKVIFSKNLIKDSRRNGLQIAGDVAELTVDGVVIDNPAGAGIEISDKAKGAGLFQRNSIRNLSTGKPAFRNESPKDFKISASGNTW